MQLLIVLCILCLPLPVYSLVVSSAVIPHGDFAFDPSFVKFENGSVRIHDATYEASKFIAQSNPDVIFLTTPHGIALDEQYAVYTNSAGAGYAILGSDLQLPASDPNPPTYTESVSVKLAQNLSVEISKFERVTGMLGYGDAQPINLAWGEVIPLRILAKQLVARSSGIAYPPVIVFSFPSKRFTNASGMVPELLELGPKIYQFLDGLKERVSIVISSDLAHTHLASGPYGYSPTAEPFDRACGQWAKNFVKNSNELLVNARELADDAKSCGYTGLVLLHGMLSSAGSNHWTSRLLGNEHPTYYGMMAAIFSRND
jgi:aromatic ring-opening dioxygenase LigB subunit